MVAHRFMYASYNSTDSSNHNRGTKSPINQRNNDLTNELVMICKLIAFVVGAIVGIVAVKFLLLFIILLLFLLPLSSVIDVIAEFWCANDNNDYVCERPSSCRCLFLL